MQNSLKLFRARTGCAETVSSSLTHMPLDGLMLWSRTIENIIDTILIVKPILRYRLQTQRIYLITSYILQ